MATKISDTKEWIASRLTFRRALQIIDTKAFGVVFAEIMSSLEELSKGRIVAIDGKALTSTFHKDGRIEHRKYYLFRDLSWFEDIKEWTRITGLLMVQSKRTLIKKGDNSTTETRLYITSLKTEVREIAEASRARWGVENNLHWVLDVGFREDQWQVREQIEAANLSQIRRFSANILKLETESKLSIPRKRYLCSLDTNFMEKVFKHSKLFS